MGEAVSPGNLTGGGETAARAHPEGDTGRPGGGGQGLHGDPGAGEVGPQGAAQQPTADRGGAELRRQGGNNLFCGGGGWCGDKREIQHRVRHQIATRGRPSRWGKRQQVGVERELAERGGVIPCQAFRLPDQVPFEIHAFAFAGHVVVVEVHHAGPGVDAAGPCRTDDRVIQQNRGIAVRLAVPLFHGDGVVAVVDQIVDYRDLAVSRIVRAAGDRTGTVGGCRVPVAVHKNVPFNPGIGAVEVENVVVGTVEDAVEDLQDGAGAVTAGEVDAVVVTLRLAEPAVADDASSSGGNAAGAVDRFKSRRGGGENTVADGEGTAVQREILYPGVVEGQMVQAEVGSVLGVEGGGAIVGEGDIA